MSLYSSRNKKGQFSNVMAIILFLFAFTFMSIIGYVIYDSFIDEFTAEGYLTDPTAQKAEQGFRRGMNTFDYIVVLILVMMIISLAVTSIKIYTSPVFFVVWFLMSVFLGFVAYFYNYIFQELVGNAIFNTVTVHFPLSIMICTNLHWVVLVAFVVGAITLYAKGGKSEEL